MSYWDMGIRILSAVLLGGLIGLERQTKHRPAGFRTHILVCVGAATVMILSELIFDKFYIKYGIAADPSRLGAQVISGIGFLGAGTIIHFGANVKGLTTAASLWAVAAIGLAVGSGFYILAGAVTLILLITLFLFGKISKRMRKAENTFEITIVLVNKPKIIGHINLVLAKSEAKILDMVYTNPASDMKEDTDKDDVISISIVFSLAKGMDCEEIIQTIRMLKGVQSVALAK
ncbi:MAG: MgtC/SapB family protein [Clostridiales bacterium]|nr:MgtC/SapB family protein [Clostridiales bacterium]